jgi:rubrerythrin
MPALREPPLSTERLFDVALERTLEDLLAEIDDTLRHGQAAPCLVCGAALVGGDLSTAAECPSCGSKLE